MKILGLTGQSGAGKTLFSETLKELGHPCINADELYHSLLVPPSEILDAIELAFGKDFFLEDGSLDRKKMAKHVFASTEQLDKLNRAVLPIMSKKVTEIAKQLEQDGANLVVIDAPTLFEAGLDSICDLTVSIIASVDVRIERISARDGISREDALLRTNAQKPDEFYYKRSDFVLSNNSSPEKLKGKARALVDSIGFSPFKKDKKYEQ